ncbi:MAG: hypothetical protein SGILL_008394, partial [Bacillariaceae sp.]
NRSTMSSSCEATSLSTGSDEVEEKPVTEETQEERYKWRGDPTETWSDWKIVVSTTDLKDDGGQGEARTKKKGDAPSDDTKNVSSTTYHVHKSSLAFGIRKSGYFANLFRNAHHCSEADSCTSTIELDGLAAKEPLKITEQTATALHWLGEYFDVRNLRCDALDFCKKNVSLKNIHLYYKRASRLHDEVIMNLVASFANIFLEKIEKDSPILRLAKPTFWLMVLQKAESESGLSDERSLHWSKLVAEIGNNIDIDLETFNGLTQLTSMPLVDSNVALQLCELSDALCSEGTPKSSNQSTLENMALQQRCAVALARDWEESENWERYMLETRKPPILTDVLIKSLLNARNDLTAARKREKVLEEKKKEADRAAANLTREIACMTTDKNLLRTEVATLKSTAAAISKFRQVGPDETHKITRGKLDQAMPSGHSPLCDSYSYSACYQPRSIHRYPLFYYDDGYEC